jgi:drug/metabolite transporter (DMT)-like permease
MAAIPKLSGLDALLLLMAVIWGTNYSVIKSAFREVQPQAFNAARMLIASAALLAVMAVLGRAARRRPAAPDAGPGGFASIFHTPAAVTPREWLHLAALGVVGHMLYQSFFIAGLSRTSVANSSLMLAATPVVIALISAALGYERIGRLHWFGAILSMAGIYLVVGHGAPSGDASFAGDAMMFVAVCCWAIYTLGARQLMLRHSPVGVTGFSMAIGTLIYVPLVLRKVLATDWTSVSAGTWLAIVYSALFALCIAYTIWYMAVREIGSARTSVYSNLVPIVAMLTAVVFLGEAVTLARLSGAAAVLLGVALTRVGKAAPVVPPEE